MDDGAPKRVAHRSQNALRVGKQCGVLTGHLEDGPQIFHGNILFKEQLKDALQCGDRDHLGHHILNQLGIAGLEMLQEVLCLLPAKQLVRVCANQMVKVGGHNDSRLNHGVALINCLIALVALDPDRRHAIGRVFYFNAHHGLCIALRIDG